jgi:ferrous iron transport protein B
VDEEESQSLAARIRADSSWTKANAMALMVFILLYSRCFVTLLIIRQETASAKWLFLASFLT